MLLRRVLVRIGESDLETVVKREVLDPPFPNRPWRAPAYGLGVAIDRDTAHGPAYGHLGGGPGCSPAAYHFPQLNSGTTIAVISDGEDTLPEDIILTIAGEIGCRKI
jgi:hypothetical protein